MLRCDLLSKEVSILLSEVLDSSEENGELLFINGETLEINWREVERVIFDGVKKGEGGVWRSSRDNHRLSTPLLKLLFREAQSLCSSFSEEKNLQLERSLLPVTKLCGLRMSPLKSVDFHSLCPHTHLPHLLSVCALIEKVLRRVFQMESPGSECAPFLLKDLLLTPNIESTIGTTRTYLLILILGSVWGLNIRNLAWHGFLPNTRISKGLLLFLFILLADISQVAVRRIECESLLESSAELIPGTFQREIMDKLDKILPPKVEDCSLLLECLRRNENIPEDFANVLRFLPTLIETRSDLAVMFILVMIESSLRTLFVNANNLNSNRLLCALQTEFYTTLDQILSPSVKIEETENNSDSTTKNKLQDVLDVQLQVILQDLFNFMQGPRLRDKISHGEIVLENLDPSTANRLLGLLFVCSNINVINDTSGSSKADVDDKAVILECFGNNFEQWFTNYENLYHPHSILKFSLIENIEEIRNWLNWPVVNDEDFPVNQWEQIETVYSSKFFYEGFFDEQTISSLGSIDHLIAKLTDFRVKVIFRSRRELEFSGLISRINANCKDIIENTKTSLATRKASYEARTLRSRRRENYLKQLNTVPTLVDNCYYLLNLLCALCINVNSTDQISAVKYKTICKTMKTILKNVENTVTYSGENSNKWMEAGDVLKRNSDLITQHFCTSS